MVKEKSRKIVSASRTGDQNIRPIAESAERSTKQNGEISSASDLQLDTESLAHLRHSLEQIGQLTSVLVCKQHTQRILGGNHRVKAAGGLQKVDKKEFDVEALAEKLDVNHAIAETLVVINSNVQRRVSREETRALILNIARSLESSSNTQQKIGKKLCEILPFSDSYILRLLPSGYKETKFTPLKHRAREETVEPEVELVQPPKPDATEDEHDAQKFHPIDMTTKCVGCGTNSARGNLKQTLLCLDCRRKVGVHW